MVMKALRLLKRIFLTPVDFVVVNIFRRYPVFYFDSISNVGDLINPYLVNKLSGKKAHQVRSRSIRHVVGLGSMFHMANKNSVIWGTGIISDDVSFRKMTNCHSVNSVRGHLTKNILIENGVIGSNHLPLGDPGLLMPNFYNPIIRKQYKIGIIPHYVDIDSDFFKGLVNSVVIDVQQDPESFIDELLKCEYVVSSSLHGLILADSYGVPNKWVSFSDRITGGTFKFHDYYSTTDNSDEDCFVCLEKQVFKRLIHNIDKYASIKEFAFDKDELIKSFPVF
ncbi:conserved hypothetical protein [Marinobacter salarius]|uniref:polysaccharide pyruvyl transferase family protein n=1 Tax=Marinobacter salarius TaxID=1420917 RepID=UPI001252B6B8|nr:polysaccharide pyruvyl transferase family protein [Marinobacter salarius]VVT06218.1 conserved hypothetical protein [Marinobacter salarius]VXC07623.1 conserved hypothetical protein [Marinobacter salarius]